MKLAKCFSLAVAISAIGGVAMAHPISLEIEAANGMFMDVGQTVLLPAGAYYQVWWSSDNAYGADASGNVDLLTASQGTSGAIPSVYGDYVIWSGTTPLDGQWGGVSSSSGTLTDAAVNNNVISSGFIYAYVYEDGTPNIGDSFIRSPNIQGNTWGDPSKAQPDPSDLISLAPDTGNVFGTYHVVPEPGSMALFGLGMLTIAVRRRFRK